MRIRYAIPLALLIAAAGPSVIAQDAPHWSGASLTIDCTSNCHTLHQAQGTGLTAHADNENLCFSCHFTGGVASDVAISNADKAVPHVVGTSHAFGVAATQDFDGDGINDVVPPANSGMALRVMNGNIVCSTCHNQHKSEATTGGTPRVGNARMLTTNGSIDGLIPGGDYTGAEGQWYLVAITVSGNQSNAKFGFSKDNGTSWFPNNCVPGGTTTGCLTANGATPVGLDAGVTLTFAPGSYVAGDRWEFSASWPFLRATHSTASDGSILCRDCHSPWVNTTADVRTWDGGVKSHPVGVSYPAPSPDDLFHDVPLDGDAAGDTNASNDLTFDGSGHIECMTCHGVHFVDSNTLTEDGP